MHYYYSKLLDVNSITLGNVTTEPINKMRCLTWQPCSLGSPTGCIFSVLFYFF